MKEELIKNITFQTEVDFITSVKSSGLLKKTRLETFLTLAFSLYLSWLIVFSLSKNRADLDLDYKPSNLLFLFAA